MSSFDRSKRRVQLWKKAIVHFLLCFVMGFFTGFAPTAKSSIFSSQASTTSRLSEFSQKTIGINRSLATEIPAEVSPIPSSGQAKLLEEEEEEDIREEPHLVPRKLLIVVTPTSSKDRFRDVFLRRLANTLQLVPPPLLWVVVESNSDSSRVSETLRKTGVMYRHLVFKQNFTNIEEEMDYQGNIALNHIEHHRLSGIVHFAGLYNFYDLGFFDQIRETEVFGAWPIAMLSANRKRVKMEGPVCESSQVIGWHLRENTYEAETESPVLHISSFGFNSSILWDPERWGRASAVQDTSQNSLKFVKQEVLEDETKLKGIPSEDCSKIMMWNLHFPSGIPPPKPSEGIQR